MSMRAQRLIFGNFRLGFARIFRFGWLGLAKHFREQSIEFLASGSKRHDFALLIDENRRGDS